MANTRLRPLSWWKRWTKQDWAISTVGCIVIIFFFSLFSDSDVDSTVNALFGSRSSSTDDLVDLTLLRNAKTKGAYCLDGSLPGYHYLKGFGNGSSNWILHLEGGGWCDSISSCSSRKMTPLGSSNYMESQVRFSGILSSNPLNNPDFFNWNKVKIRYCDGASFAGHPESELKNETALFFRGQLIWEAVVDELLPIGLSKAKQALLTGCSAGGLATLIHCDDFRERFPKDTTVKCFSDAGFFLDLPDVMGHLTMRSFYNDVVQLQDVTKSLDKNCVAKMNSMCLFPQEIVKNVKTPMFVLNPAYDFWQIHHVLVPAGSDPHHYWRNCRLNMHNCDDSQMEVLQGFRSSMLKAVSELEQKKDSGILINSCFIHCQTLMAETWHSFTSPRTNNKSIAEHVGDWYFNREIVKQIDPPYPGNPTCYNMDFTRS